MIERDNFNGDRKDRTLWHTLTKKVYYLMERNRHLHLTESSFAFNGIVTSTINTDNKQTDNKGGKKKFSKPSLEEIEQHFKEQKIKDSKSCAEKFYNHYENCDWKYGKTKTPIKNWKRCLTNWDFEKEQDRYKDYK